MLLRSWVNCLLKALLCKTRMGMYQSHRPQRRDRINNDGFQRWTSSRQFIPSLILIKVIKIQRPNLLQLMFNSPLRSSLSLKSSLILLIWSCHWKRSHSLTKEWRHLNRIHSLWKTSLVRDDCSPTASINWYRLLMTPQASTANYSMQQSPQQLCKQLPKLKSLTELSLMY